MGPNYSTNLDEFITATTLVNVLSLGLLFLPSCYHRFFTLLFGRVIYEETRAEFRNTESDRVLAG